MNLLHELTKKLKPYQDNRFLLAVSGGLDSMAMLALFSHFKKHFGFQFSVAHFHHGPTENDHQREYRNQAKELVQKACENQGITFYCNWQDQDEREFLKEFTRKLTSENDFRQARYDFFQELLDEYEFQWLVLAHHCDDLLETRLLKLIRGVGPDKLYAMKFISGQRMRPLLSFSRSQLEEYLQFKDGRWLEDPSNENVEPLRNWIRQTWLPQLEEKQPGGLHSLGRSLDLLVHRPETEFDWAGHCDGKGLILESLATLGVVDRRRVIANYMRGQGLKNYGQSHINEVLKRLDMEQKKHMFKLLGRRWFVDAGRMSVEQAP